MLQIDIQKRIDWIDMFKQEWMTDCIEDTGYMESIL